MKEFKILGSRTFGLLAEEMTKASAEGYRRDGELTVHQYQMSQTTFFELVFYQVMSREVP